jgi:Protein of unknown function (DUF3891)
MPAWVAIAARQKQCAQSWWLVAQPDHANLSGELAANFVSPKFPRIDPAVAKAIALHDAGWAIFPAEADPTSRPMISDDFKPRSFIEFPPGDFLRAWTGSIERAEYVATIGGIIVSRHFCWLAEIRLREKVDDGSGEKLVRDFLDREAVRQQRLSNAAGISADHAGDLLKVLQFCDVLSLYLCCGADEEVEFPQRFDGGTVRLKRMEDLYVLTPSPFQANCGTHRTVSLGVAARKYPAQDEPRTATLPFLLQ